MMLALTGSGLVGSGLDSKIAPYIDGSISSCEYFVIGCEDANLSASSPDVVGSDWDINDVCFLIVGLDKAPKIKEIVSKRYLIEDLGSTWDFDFNDIVVDVTQETLKKVGATSGTVTQTAEIKTLGGTLPFKVKVGDTVFDEVNPNSYHSGTVPQRGFHPSAYGWAKMEITGWNPSTNNIKITVGTEAKEGATELETARTIDFPEVGKTPYIIAVDQTVDWSDEEVKVPSNWFKTWIPKQYNDWNNRDWGNTPNYGTELNYTLSKADSPSDGVYAWSNISLGDLLSGNPSSITLTFVCESDMSFKGQFGVNFKSVGNDYDWKGCTGEDTITGKVTEVVLTSEEMNEINGNYSDYKDLKYSFNNLSEAMAEKFTNKDIKVYYKVNR